MYKNVMLRNLVFILKYATRLIHLYDEITL